MLQVTKPQQNPRKPRRSCFVNLLLALLFNYCPMFFGISIRQTPRRNIFHCVLRKQPKEPCSGHLTHSISLAGVLPLRLSGNSSILVVTAREPGAAHREQETGDLPSPSPAVLLRAHWLPRSAQLSSSAMQPCFPGTSHRVQAKLFRLHCKSRQPPDLDRGSVSNR